MGVVIESEVWEPNRALYIFIFVGCFFSIFCLPLNTNRNTTVFDHSLSPSYLRFQRGFLFLYSLSSVVEGLWTVFGEFELVLFGVSREQIVLSLCVGCLASLLIGSFLGILADIIGQKKACLLFYMLHIFVAVWKRVIGCPSIWLASLCLSLASLIFSFSFETWMVVEHDKLGQRQDTLNDMFWLMTFSESASFIGGQVLSNWLVQTDIEKNIAAPSNTVMLLAIIATVWITRGWKETPTNASFKDYQTKLYTHVFKDKRIWLLSWAQACVHFSIAVFWILWAPTIVADGREVLLGLIYPCLMGARMLGSTSFPWFSNGPLSMRTEELLVYALIAMGFVLSIVAYDYQEIGVLVALFSIFHAGIGLVLPSLARLRSMYVPNELRGGVMSLSVAPSNAAVLLVLLQRGYYRHIENSTVVAIAALALFSAAGCMHVLRQLGKQLHQNWLKL